MILPRRIAISLLGGYRPFCIGLLVAAVALAASGAHAQSYWELTPYRIKLILAVDAASRLDPRLQSDLRMALAERAEATLGAPWDCEVVAAGLPLRYQVLGGATGKVVEHLADELDKWDKIMLLAVRTRQDGYEVEAREFDCATRQWSRPHRRDTRQRSRLTETAFEAWLEAFRTLARVAGAEGESATLQLRAAALPPADPAWSTATVGKIFQPIVRRNERDGSPQAGGIEALPWTFLVVEEFNGLQVNCRVHSGIRSPLSVRRRGRVELYALAVDAGAAPTQLELRAQGEAQQPLSGYAIYSEPPSSQGLTLLGVTDRQGRVAIQPDPQHGLRVLYVKHGSKLLARLPIVPGLTSQQSVSLRSDDLRLQIEGQLRGLEEALVDLVARRELLLARIHARLDAADVEGATELLNQLRRLPTRERFAQEVSQLENSIAPRDKQLQAEIQQLCARTKSLLGKYLDVQQITEVQRRLNAARKG